MLNIFIIAYVFIQQTNQSQLLILNQFYHQKLLHSQQFYKMNLQNILKNKQDLHQTENDIDEKSVLYKHHDNGEWKRVQEDTPVNLNKDVLTKKEFPRKQTQNFIKKFENDKSSYTILNDFESFRVFNKLLGEGTYSKVFLGENKKTKRLVAIKQVQKLQENQIACLMNSQSKFIIKMYSFWNSGRFSYIVLQLCESNLRQNLTKSSIQQKIDYFEQIIEGMDYLNRKKIIHRDLKFQNILLKQRTIKISDFGFAKPIGSKLSVISEKCGTPYTMAPQIYFFKGQGKPLYTHKCDIYSLGVILHQMLYQKHPFDYCSKKMQNNQRIQVKKNFGYLDILIDRSLEPEVVRRCNWQEFMQIFSLHKMKKAQESNETFHFKNRMKEQREEFKQNHPEKMKQTPKKKPQTSKLNLLKYKRKIYKTPVKTKITQSHYQQGFQNKRQEQKQNPFKKINLNKDENNQERKFLRQYHNQYNPRNLDCNHSVQKQQWKYEHDQILKPKTQIQMFQEETISVTKFVALILALLIVIVLAQTVSQ